MKYLAISTIGLEETTKQEIEELISAKTELRKLSESIQITFLDNKGLS